MNRRPVLVVTGLLLVAFGVGVRVGSRFSRKPTTDAQEPAPLPSARAPVSAVAGSPPPCVDIRNAVSLVGKNGCVEGIVAKVYSARTGNTFLDFCQDYRTCPFTSVIFAVDKPNFGNIESMQGKRVEIRGDVINYQGRAEIIIHNPQQVRSAP